MSALNWLQKRFRNGSSLTSAGTSVCRHGVSVLRTCALIAPRNVHTLVGAQMADALRALVDVWGDMGEYQSGETKTQVWHTDVARQYGRKELPTVAGVPVLLEEVALSAVTLVGAVDVGALLAARAGQALVHIWRLEVRAHYCRSLIKEAPSLHVNKTML